MKSFFGNISCNDNREGRPICAEERLNADAFETPICPNGGRGDYGTPGDYRGLPGDHRARQRGLGFCDGRGCVSSHRATFNVPGVDSYVVTGAKRFRF